MKESSVEKERNLCYGKETEKFLSSNLNYSTHESKIKINTDNLNSDDINNLKTVNEYYSENVSHKDKLLESKNKLSKITKILNDKKYSGKNLSKNKFNISFNNQIIPQSKVMTPDNNNSNSFLIHNQNSLPVNIRKESDFDSLCKNSVRISLNKHFLKHFNYNRN